MQRNANKHTAAGFTLIELMITVAIVAILGTIAMASYSKQIQKSRRTDARSAVLDMAGREEKLFSTTNAYSNDAFTLGYANAAATPWPIQIGSGYYNIQVTTPTNTSYSITATAINSQANDTMCATFTLDQLGNQGSTGTATPSTCWGN